MKKVRLKLFCDEISNVNFFSLAKNGMQLFRLNVQVFPIQFVANVIRVITDRKRLMGWRIPNAFNVATHLTLGVSYYLSCTYILFEMKNGI